MSNIAHWYLRTAVTIVIIGMALGLHMAGSEDFTLAPVHAHMNVIGWLSFFGIGLYYRQVPEAGRTRLARLQFFVLLSGLVVMVASLGMLLSGGNHAIWGPIAGLGGALLLAGMILFAVTVFADRGAETGQGLARRAEGGELSDIGG